MEAQASHTRGSGERVVIPAIQIRPHMREGRNYFGLRETDTLGIFFFLKARNLVEIQNWELIYGLSRATSSSLGATSSDTPVTVGQKWAILLRQPKSSQRITNMTKWLLFQSIDLQGGLLCCNRRLEPQEGEPSWIIESGQIWYLALPSFHLNWPGHLN